jgi:ABC-type branched-subunit amino acid transport system substrate-binding protein
MTRGSWVKAVKIQKELGGIKDWKIYGSDLPQSGDFNMILMVMFNSAADAEPNKKRYQKFMKKWGAKNEKGSNKISATYPEVRTLTGEYRFREIMMK